LSIPDDRLKIREGTVYRLSSKSKSEYGVVSLRLTNKVFRSIVLHVLNSIKNLVEKNYDFCRYYFKGLLSGDGSIPFNGNTIECVSIAYNPHSDELEHYQKILNVLKIFPNESSIKHRERKNIQITSWRNFYQILKITDLKPFIQNEKNLKFYNGFLNNQYVNSLARLEKLSEHKGITVKIYSNLFNVGLRSSSNSLLRFVKLDLLKREKKGIEYLFKLTKKGKEFLKLLEYLEGMRFNKREN